ncbi:ATP-binding protein [Curtobacterium sp. 24E2]
MRPRNGQRPPRRPACCAEHVGREEADLAAVSDLLSAGRLVTILGAGGLGKTRLAQAVAAGLPPTQGVVVVELAPLASADDIVPALGALLGIAEFRSTRSLRDAVAADLRTRVVRALADGPTVLVLDNCEHLVAEVAAFAADLLATVPALRILTTSRAPLAIAGEVVAPLAPLPVEADGAAVRLFTERARAARPGAVLPVDTVRRICTRLDGSPLAIELAAARIRGMSADEIERRLDDRFALLRGGDRSAPERHRTLLAVIEWSWRLLDDGAQDLLTRLALFPDGLAVDAVEAVAAPDRRADALDDLAELVEQSLVQLVEHEGEPVRYRLLETVREFGAARLGDRGATEAVRAAMIGWGRGSRPSATCSRSRVPHSSSGSARSPANPTTSSRCSAGAWLPTTPRRSRTCSRPSAATGRCAVPTVRSSHSAPRSSRSCAVPDRRPRTVPRPCSDSSSPAGRQRSATSAPQPWPCRPCAA